MALNHHSAARVQNQNTKQTIKTGQGQLLTINASNAHATVVGTVAIIRDGATIGTLRVEATKSNGFWFDGLGYEVSLEVTPSIVELDITVEYD